MSEFTWQPLNGATPEYQPRVMVASFGDGYQQRVADGINNMPQVWQNLTFRGTAAYVNEILDFLIARGGVDSFTWTPSGFDEITVFCPSWSRPVISNGIGELTCSFIQVFGE